MSKERNGSEKWHAMDVEEVLSKLNASKNGLSEQDVADRQKKYGLNKIEIKEKYKILKMFVFQFTDFLVVLLIISGIISFYMGYGDYVAHGDIKEIIDAIAIFSIVLINGLIGFVQDYRSNKALEKLKEYFEQEVLTVRGGSHMKINSSELVPGDIILLENGNKVPADCRIVESHMFKCDEAILTGESRPIKKREAPVSKKAKLYERINILFMGTSATYGRATAVVVNTGMNTEMGRIAQLTQVKKELTPLQKSLDRLGKVLGTIILVICGIVMIVDISILGIENWIESFKTAIALAISAVPEGLPAAIIITYAIGVSRMAKKRTIVSHLPAVETLGSVDYICSDKTGTLTKNEMTVTQIWTSEGLTEVSGTGYIPEGQFIRNERYVKPNKDPTLDLLMEVIYNCNNAELLKDGPRLDIKGDPTEAAMVVAAEKWGLSPDLKLPRIYEFFFDSERKRMTTINEKDGKYYAYVKGSPPTILKRCTKIMINGEIQELSELNIATVNNANVQMSSQALRVLGVAYREVNKDFDREDDIEIENNLVFLGLTGMIDPPREEVRDAIRECRKAGITTIMVTGDQRETAIAIAKETEIILSDDDLIIGGRQLEKMSKYELQDKIRDTRVFYRMSADDKYRVVKNLQDQDHTVAVTGDGVNDAPALKKADIGVAMGITGTDVSKEVADMVITDDAFHTIVSAIEEGRNIFENMKKFIRYLLACNFDEIFTTLLITSLFGVLPFLPLQILFLNLLTDALPALALSFDPYDPALMEQDPKSKAKSFVKDMYGFAVVAGVAAFCVSIVVFLTSYLLVGPMIFSGPNAEQNILAYAQMMTFTETLVFELMFVFIARNDNRTKFIESRPFKNTFLLWSIAISWIILFAIIYIPGLQGIFCNFSDYYMITLRDWGILFGYIMASQIIIEFWRAYIIDKNGLKELKEYKKWAQRQFHKHDYLKY
ncbi:MAG: HAD-IC family P-type ATPase [Candidatus Lokiarchaeota archaeon]|nr:HAD-IC family P-type ATPase [Candidatus Lokiarchaeota archaeon]